MRADERFRIVRQKRLFNRGATNLFATKSRSLSLLSTSIKAICEHSTKISSSLKEVINPRFPYGYLIYDFTPVMNHTVVNALPKVKLLLLVQPTPHGVTGGVQGRERIHRNISDLRITSDSDFTSRVADSNRPLTRFLGFGLARLLPSVRAIVARVQPLAMGP